MVPYASKSFKILFLILLLPLFCFAKDGQKICLNMIVKDEKDVITRCLKTTLPIIDYYVIVDTGSSDGTQDIIKTYMKENGVPGELHEKPWLNFEHNRNEALKFAKGKGDYTLFIDADEQLLYEPDFKLPKLDKDFYFVEMTSGGVNHARVHFIKDNLNWHWEGVLHEYVTASEAKTSGKIEKVVNLYSQDGARAKDPLKYHKDAAILEEAVKKDPTNTRNVFYLAQCYRDAGEHEKSFINYEKRSKMGGWNEEVYWSLVEMANRQKALGKDSAVIADAYKTAFRYRPSRVEALYLLANHYREEQNYQKAYETAKLGIGIPPSKDLLLVANWMTDYGIPLEASIAAWWTDRFEESKAISLELLKKEKLPEHVRTCVENNLGFANAKLLEKMD